MPEDADIFAGATRLDLRDDLSQSAAPTREDIVGGQPDDVRSRAERTLEGLEPVTPYLYDGQAKYPLLAEQVVPTAVPDSDVPDGVHFGCKVVLYGGFAGDQTTRCNYSYTLYEMDGVTVMEDTDTNPVQPQHPRPLGRQLAPADLGYGVAFYDENDEISLWSAGEVPDKAQCDT